MSVRWDLQVGGLRSAPTPGVGATREGVTGMGLAVGLDREVSRVGAQERLEGELRSIAIDIMGPHESDELPPACADWVATTADVVVSRVSDGALAALVRGLDALLIAAPPEVTRQLERAKARHEAGFD